MTRGELLENLLGPMVRSELGEETPESGGDATLPLDQVKHDRALHGRRVKARLARGLPLEGEDFEISEAIVLPEYRPVALVKNGDWPMNLPHWARLDDAPVRTSLKKVVAATCRLEIVNSDVPLVGTGFLVGPGLVVTNRHVAKWFVNGLGFGGELETRVIANFNGEFEDTTPREQHPEVVEAVMVHPYFDMAILRLADNGGTPLDIELHLPEQDRTDIAVVGFPVYDYRNDHAVQQEVFGGIYNVKRVQPGQLTGHAMRKSFHRHVNTVKHDASTLGGNSGSPVVTFDGKVVALHFQGRYRESNYALAMGNLARDPRIRDALSLPAPHLANLPDAFAEYWEDLERPLVPVVRAPRRSAAPGAIHGELPLRITIDVSTGDATPQARVAPESAPEAAPPTGDEPEDDEGAFPEFGRSLVRDFASRYRLRDGEQSEFDASWRLVSHLARGGLSRAARKKHRHLSGRMVDAAGRYLRQAILGAPSNAVGHRVVERRPLQGQKYVIFSDHHITYADHRQEFFRASGNLDIFRHALEKYGEQDYVLVENGDVEELLIWDPRTFPEHMALRKGWDSIRDPRYHDELPRFLLQQRLALRRKVLQRILETQPEYYDAVRPFAKAGRWVRVAGNHDYNLQGDVFAEAMRSIDLPFEHVYDYLLLQDADDPTAVRYAILHGHQFDLTTNPAVAPRFGESFSESIAVWFEGADRTWKWRMDGPERWALGQLAFNNTLTEDNHDGFVRRAGEGDPIGPEDLPYGFEHIGDSLEEAEGALASLLAGAATGGGEPVESEESADDEGVRLGRAFIEKLFGHAVAWEHFEGNGAIRAVINEAWSGVRADLNGDGRYDVTADGEPVLHRRFFKYRHTNEQELARQLIRDFPDAASRPTVVLGHTHEPRFHSTIPEDFVRRLRRSGSDEDRRVAETLTQMGGRFPHYINSASAGRFERLVWAVEIDETGARLVTWARPDNNQIERRVWQVTEEGLRAAAAPTEGP